MANSGVPSLTQRDATIPDFWNERFEHQFTPWNHGGVPLAVKNYFQRLTPNQSALCLIPGCGHGYEAAYLSELGWDVVALDFSSVAVERARTAHPTWAQRIIEADFFTYHPTKTVNIIYERAFLCALPAHRRAAIVARWAELLPSKGLLVGLFYILEQPSKKGPPFALSQGELNALMASDFTCVENKSVDDALAVFEQGERWQIWQRI